VETKLLIRGWKNTLKQSRNFQSKAPVFLLIHLLIWIENQLIAFGLVFSSLLFSLWLQFAFLVLQLEICTNLHRHMMQQETCADTNMMKLKIIIHGANHKEHALLLEAPCSLEKKMMS